MPPKLIHRILLERYRVDEFIAAGGMGAVYRVYDLERNAPLAMKILHDDLADDPAFVRRFEREAKNLEKLTHPNIVPFYGLVHDDEFVFLLQAYIDGNSLKELLSRRGGRPFSPQESLVWIKSLQAALGYAHVNHVIHCDLKPGNVMIDQGGHIYLTDFGIARETGGGSATLTSAGSPGYMAPEQIRGEALSPATDVYALGVLLFELLTGRRPFVGDEPGSQQAGDTTSQRILYAHLYLPPPDLCSLNPALPATLATVIDQALEKDPARRYAKPQALYSDLLNALDVDPATVADRWFPPQPVKTDPGTTLREPLPAAFSGPTVLEGPPPEIKGTQAGKPKKPRAWLILGTVTLALLAVMALGWSGWNWLAGRGLTTPETSLVGLEPSSTPSSRVEPAGQSQAANLPADETTSPDPSSSTLKPREVIQEEPTPTDTPLSPSPTPEAPVEDPRKYPPVYEPIPGCAASRLKPGMWTFVSIGGGQNAIRSNPDLHAGDNWVGVAEEGELLLVVGGPECNLKHIVWEVWKDNELTGWTPESDGTEFWLEPFPSWNACPNAPPSTLLKGERAVVALYPDSANRLREKPGLKNPETGKIFPGESVLIVNGPRCADGFVWWRVRALEDGAEGWTAEGKVGESWLLPEARPDLGR